ncbi:hypothetical protein HY440_00180 [Candidatus Microgenomates bacterium]|nr:hypothetical protein [Candidatus Microgenomates bacterium]
MLAVYPLIAFVSLGVAATCFYILFATLFRAAVKLLEPGTVIRTDLADNALVFGLALAGLVAMYGFYWSAGAWYENGGTSMKASVAIGIVAFVLIALVAALPLARRKKLTNDEVLGQAEAWLKSPKGDGGR